MTIREQMLPIGTRVRHLKGFPGDDQRTYPAGIEGLIVSHGSLGYHGISFVFEDIEATFLFLADEVEVLPVISAEETLRAELEATRKTLTEVEGRARRYAEERDAAQSALTVRYAMRREIEAKLGMVSGEANDESLRRGLEAIRALEAEGVRWCDLAAAETVRADKAERDITASRAEVERLTRERDEIDALAQRYSDEALAASPALAGQGLNAGMMVAVARAEKAERERDDARADRDEAEGKRDVAQQERDEAREEREYHRRAEHEAITRRVTAERERDEARAQVMQAAKTRVQYQEERDEARAQLLREATTTRLTAYRILAQIAVDADDTDEAAADDLRSLLDVLWRQLTDADRAAFRDEAEKPR